MFSQNDSERTVGDSDRQLCPVTGKVCYSQRAASETVRFFKRGRNRKSDKNIPSRCYWCQFCGTYHLTHYRRKRERRKK